MLNRDCLDDHQRDVSRGIRGVQDQRESAQPAQKA